MTGFVGRGVRALTRKLGSGLVELGLEVLEVALLLVGQRETDCRADSPAVSVRTASRRQRDTRRALGTTGGLDIEATFKERKQQRFLTVAPVAHRP
jgi:hypothetical protein